MSAPTLLVGLGGAGSEIVRLVHARASEVQRKSIGFVVLDTDVNELRDIEERTSQIKTIQTSTTLSVGEYLEYDSYARDCWFPVNRILTSKSLTEGAGQVRATSRLALNTAIQQGRMSVLDEAIEELYKVNGQKTIQAPRVILVGSLCGGTGSGLILPVSMYIRNFLTTRMQASTAIIRGLFLLPEVFYGVIKGQSERRRLHANAYAAVREINAFLMKSDETIPQKYDLHFMAPRAGSSEPEEYFGRPMDFCFLFDAQNISGKKLNSTQQYKEHAADCIYGMAIAPTNKRSNSSEDNVISKLVEEGGRNRFAGTGTSMLIYPAEDICRYVALNWAKDTISNEWLLVDERLEAEQRENSRRRSQGVGFARFDAGDKYIEIINEGHTQQKPFETSIKEACLQMDGAGFSEEGRNWELYAEALANYVAESAKQYQKLYAKDYIASIDDCVEVLSSGEEPQPAKKLTDYYDAIINYKAAAIKCSRNLARNIIFTLFKDSKDYSLASDKYRIEYWLRPDGSPDQFIHPSAVRYFLYAARRELKERLAKSEKRLKKATDSWESFEVDTFDDPETEGTIESIYDYLRKHKISDQSSNPIIKFLNSKDASQSIQDLLESFGAHKGHTDTYWKESAVCEVYRGAIDYIEALSESYNKFYNVLSRRIPAIDKEIAELEEKYVLREGQTCRYVCADKECLRSLLSKMFNTLGADEIPAAMARNVFSKVRAFTLAEVKPESERYFSELFGDSLIGFYEDTISDDYSSIIGMDIIDALYEEAQIKDPGGAYAETGGGVYAKRVIESARILAEPFIESPGGIDDRRILSCAYNEDLENSEIVGRKTFVNSVLRSGGGVPDASIEKNMILFYESVYGLRADELSKFAPASVGKTHSHGAGVYYKDYYALIKQIHPDPQKSKAISPHIDRWWHLINILPDLSDSSQSMQEERINAAFFWGVLLGYIEFEKKDSTHFIYKPDTSRLQLGIEDGDSWLVVSNGTLCDHLYEVLDAFTIYPKLVDSVLDCFEADVQEDENRTGKTKLTDSVLYGALRRFSVREFDNENDLRPYVIGPEAKAHLDFLMGGELDDVPETCSRSIFDLLLMMKYSVPVNEYYEENMDLLLKSIIAELKSYVPRFCDGEKFNQHYGCLMRSQFVLFVQNLIKGRGLFGDVFNDSLFSLICKTVAQEFKCCEYADDEVHVRELQKALRDEK